MSVQLVTEIIAAIIAAIPVLGVSLRYLNTSSIEKILLMKKSEQVIVGYVQNFTLLLIFTSVGVFFGYLMILEKNSVIKYNIFLFIGAFLVLFIILVVLFLILYFSGLKIKSSNIQKGLIAIVVFLWLCLVISGSGLVIIYLNILGQSSKSLWMCLLLDVGISYYACGIVLKAIPEPVRQVIYMDENKEKWYVYGKISDKNVLCGRLEKENSDGNVIKSVPLDTKEGFFHYSIRNDVQNQTESKLNNRNCIFLAETMARMYKEIVCITDKEKVIAVKGMQKDEAEKELTNEKISEDLKKFISKEYNDWVREKSIVINSITEKDNKDYIVERVSNIMGDNEMPIGAVVILSRKKQEMETNVPIETAEKMEVKQSWLMKCLKQKINRR